MEEFQTVISAIAAEHDYDLTKEDMDEGVAMFNEVDANGSGTVDIEELRAVLG